MPPLLQEVSKQLKRFTGVEASMLSGDASDDEVACLRTGFGHSEGAGCSTTWAPDALGPTCSLDDAPSAAGSSSGAAAEGGLPLDGHAVALLLTLCPPLALAASNPDNFLGALEVRGGFGVAGRRFSHAPCGCCPNLLATPAAFATHGTECCLALPATCLPQFAGAYFMTLLFGILPPVMAWQLRRKAQSRREQQPPPLRAAPAQQEAAGTAQPWWQQHADMVPGGPPLLAGLFSAALAIQLSKLAADAGLIGEGGGFVQVRGNRGECSLLFRVDRACADAAHPLSRLRQLVDLAPRMLHPAVQHMVDALLTSWCCACVPSHLCRSLWWRQL